MTTKLVEWTGRNGKRRSAILHAETANDPDKFRQWCAWNGYTAPMNSDTPPAMIDRQTGAMLIEKLDLNAISPAYAKEWARANCKVTLTGRTKDQVARSIAALMRGAHR